MISMCRMRIRVRVSVRISVNYRHSSLLGIGDYKPIFKGVIFSHALTDAYKKFSNRKETARRPMSVEIIFSTIALLLYQKSHLEKRMTSNVTQGNRHRRYFDRPCITSY